MRRQSPVVGDMLVSLLVLSRVSTLLAVPAPEDLNIHIHLVPKEADKANTDMGQGEVLPV